MDGDYMSMTFVALKSQWTHGLRWNSNTIGLKKLGIGQRVLGKRGAR